MAKVTAKVSPGFPDDYRVIRLLEGPVAAQRGIGLSRLAPDDVLPPDSAAFALVELRLSEFDIRGKMTAHDIANLLAVDSEKKTYSRYFSRR